jgi:hypothetical protein
MPVRWLTDPHSDDFIHSDATFRLLWNHLWGKAMAAWNEVAYSSVIDVPKPIGEDSGESMDTDNSESEPRYLITTSPRSSPFKFLDLTQIGVSRKATGSRLLI